MIRSWQAHIAQTKHIWPNSTATEIKKKLYTFKTLHVQPQFSQAMEILIFSKYKQVFLSFDSRIGSAT